MAASPRSCFWRMFGLALATYLSVGFVVSAVPGDYATAIFGTILFGSVLTFWAAIAPRGAPVALLFLITLDALLLVGGLVFYHEWWKLILVVVDIAAAAISLRALRLGSAYLADDKRRRQSARDYERQERWQIGPDR